MFLQEEEINLSFEKENKKYDFKVTWFIGKKKKIYSYKIRKYTDATYGFYVRYHLV